MSPSVSVRPRSWPAWDLIRYGTTGSAEEIRDTAVAQPLLVAAALAVAGRTGAAQPGDLQADAAAGHSVGELAAGVIAGVLSRRRRDAPGQRARRGHGGGRGGRADRDDAPSSAATRTRCSPPSPGTG